MPWVRLAIAAFVLTSVSGRAAAAERPWVEVRSPHFVIVSNDADGAARDAAFQFEDRIRSARKGMD